MVLVNSYQDEYEVMWGTVKINRKREKEKHHIAIYIFSLILYCECNIF